MGPTNLFVRIRRSPRWGKGTRCGRTSWPSSQPPWAHLDKSLVHLSRSLHPESPSVERGPSSHTLCGDRVGRQETSFSRCQGPWWAVTGVPHSFRTGRRRSTKGHPVFFHDPPLPLGVMGRAVSHRFTRPKPASIVLRETCLCWGPGVGVGTCQQEPGPSNSPQGLWPWCLTSNQFCWKGRGVF